MSPSILLPAESEFVKKKTNSDSSVKLRHLYGDVTVNLDIQFIMIQSLFFNSKQQGYLGG